MIRILVIVPYQELQVFVDTKLRSIDSTGFSVKSMHLYGTDKKAIADIDEDIVVARGITKEAISKNRPDIHVIGIPLLVYDFLEALYTCKKLYPGKKIGWIGSQYDLEGVSAEISAVIGCELLYAKISDQFDVAGSVEYLHDMGCEVFVGGLTVCRFCEDVGFSYVHVKTSVHAIESAIDEAIAAGRSLEMSVSRANLLATLLNNAQDAIVAVNADGTVIASNRVAAVLFGEDLKGGSIEKVYPQVNWCDAISKNNRIEMVQTVRGQYMLVVQQPISGIGVLLTFQNIERLQRVEQKIRTELAHKGLVAKYTFQNILTQNFRMQALVAKAHRYSQVDESVLLIGETGSGKELFAQSIHNSSRRHGNPFVAINCAALPENLLESELFGYVEGAFSGARRGGKIGLFELAHGGTIFLDEIGEMSINLQAKLLRVLQEKEIRKLGGDTNIPVDVRIISATNVNISEKVSRGLFRIDLFYRISLLSIRLLPLREHMDDIPVLFEWFVKHYCDKHNFRIPHILPEAYEILNQYSWPGNIRELRNYAERLAILNSAAVVGKEQILELDINATSVDNFNEVHAKSFLSPVSDTEKTLRKQLRISGLSQEDFAKSLGISRTTLWRRMQSEKSNKEPF
ncbi:sigma 54-interacting transcriptional regulator [Treponema sp. OMZ 840]|uniref:sigma 54-interacting transcriptional regulator n=1 Tax=Treponema sp. OMZ 840 TaxID=244313 RepID=UPI003D92489E